MTGADDKIPSKQAFLRMAVPTRHQSWIITFQVRVTSQLNLPLTVVTPGYQDPLALSSVDTIDNLHCLRWIKLSAMCFADPVSLQHMIGVIRMLQVGPGGTVPAIAFALAPFLRDVFGTIDVVQGHIDDSYAVDVWIWDRGWLGEF